MTTPILVNADIQTALESSDTTAIAVNKPTNLADDDIVYLLLGRDEQNSGDAITGPTGFTEITGDDSLTHTGRVFRKVITNASGEPSTYSCSWTNSEKAALCAVRITGADTDQPEDVTPSANNSTTDTFLDALSITTITADCLLLACITAGIKNGSFTPPTGMTERVDIATTGGGPGGSHVSIALAEVDQASAGPTGNKLFTDITASQHKTAFLIAVRPPPILPIITDVDTDEDIDDKQTGVVITGTDFETTQGTGKVEISDNAIYGLGNVVLQDETAWGATSITITVALGAMLPGLVRYIWITNATANRNEVGFPIRLRRAQAFSMSASSHIATSGEDTTQRLTTPATKVGGDFTAGRIQDDENPGDAVSDGLDAFFEHEWCMQAKTNANNVQYQFRILVGGKLLNIVSVDPRWTIGQPIAKSVLPDFRNRQLFKHMIGR